MTKKRTECLPLAVARRPMAEAENFDRKDLVFMMGKFSAALAVAKPLCSMCLMRCDTALVLSWPGVARQAGDRIMSGRVDMPILCKGAGEWADIDFLEGRPYTENAYTELTYTKTGFYGHKALSRTHRRFHVHTGAFTIFTFFHVHSWFFHVHLHTFSRTYFGFHVHLLFSRPHLVFAYTPPFSSSFGQTDFGHSVLEFRHILLDVQVWSRTCCIAAP